MKFPIVIASLLGVFLAPALANHNMENNFNSENSNHPEMRVSTNPKDGSEAWKTVWDFKTRPGPYELQPRENRFIISRNRLQSLSPYGKRIQALCRGIPSYLAYPAPGSNFLR
ncbi:gastrokine-1-like isoform X2 [Prinia subflava]|uniref:gastrokine-1-like isoform X2 n=1 Tax=Prinia subflava TaxID=208062 RepID=UPI002FE1A87A